MLIPPQRFEMFIRRLNGCVAVNVDLSQQNDRTLLFLLSDFIFVYININGMDRHVPDDPRIPLFHRLLNFQMIRLGVLYSYKNTILPSVFRQFESIMMIDAFTGM